MRRPLSKTRQIGTMLVQDAKDGKRREASEIAIYVGCRYRQVFEVQTRLRKRGLLPKEKP